MRVFVYKNLHKDCWSIRALDGEHKGRVVAHADRVILKDVQFRVSEAGRQRVIREGRKNVHAGVVGRLSSISHDATWRYDVDLPEVTTLDDEHDDIIIEVFKTVDEAYPVTYNPYKFSSFVYAGTHEPVREANSVSMFPNSVWTVQR